MKAIKPKEKNGSKTKYSIKDYQDSPKRLTAKQKRAIAAYETLIKLVDKGIKENGEISTT